MRNRWNITHPTTKRGREGERWREGKRERIKKRGKEYIVRAVPRRSTCLYALRSSDDLFMRGGMLWRKSVEMLAVAGEGLALMLVVTQRGF